MEELEKKVRVVELEGKGAVFNDTNLMAVLAEAEKRGHQPNMFYQLTNAGIHGYLLLTNSGIITSERRDNKIRYVLYALETKK